ncbi:MAG: hypothetical protein JXM79_23920 [Sedimentisphaerales bacterium]|nr:hypothetical protein [Sedimentisphaerales bacterium]
MKDRYPIKIVVILFLILVLQMSPMSWGGNEKGSGLVFHRTNEPGEQAFSILVPQGWRVEGGIFRVNPLQVGGPLNSVEAKCDMTLKSDSKGTVCFRILPDIVYAHAGIGAGFYPVGSSYQGAQVQPLVAAPTLLEAMLAQLRPNARAKKTLKVTALPGEKQSMERGLAYLNQLMSQIGLQSYQCDAAGAVYEYLEGDVQYREILMTGLVNMPAALTWKNTRTLAFRAPAKDFESWKPVMDIIRFSVRFNPAWFLKEAGGQQERAKIIQKVYDEIRRIDQEIVQKTTINREEIMNDNFLVLTEQEEYVNPHSGEVEVDTDAYKYRWVTPGGDIYYTNREEENPNIFLQRTDYKRTPIRKRRNE